MYSYYGINWTLYVDPVSYTACEPGGCGSNSAHLAVSIPLYEYSISVFLSHVITDFVRLLYIFFIFLQSHVWSHGAMAAHCFPVAKVAGSNPAVIVPMLFLHYSSNRRCTQV